MKFPEPFFDKRTLVYILMILALDTSLFTLHAEAEIFDRIVAFVDHEAITLSELAGQQKESTRLLPGITREEVLQSMINRVLLLREAKRYRIEAPTDEEVIKEFIDLKLRAFIHISEVQIENFYRENRDQFGEKGYEEVREEIEVYFTEKELNERLRNTIARLRKQAHIQVQLEAP